MSSLENRTQSATNLASAVRAGLSLPEALTQLSRALPAADLVARTVA